MSAYRIISIKVNVCLLEHKLLEQYNEIWKKVSNIIKKEFDSKPVYNEKYKIN